MRSFSFVHAADLHLGFSQYGLETRREDYEKVFSELVDKTTELKPDFMIIAGDLFHHARPSNATLESTIQCFGRLRNAGIPVLTVDGSHDSAPNSITGTILNPLDSAGLIYQLPRHDGACWRKPECCYVYGVPNFRTRHKTEEELPAFLSRNKPSPDPSVFNIFVFHMALDLPSVKPPYMEAEGSPEMIPERFDYYAGGHIHKPFRDKFKTGLLIYSGCTETIDYEESVVPKGFFHVRVNEERKIVAIEFVELCSPRKFVIRSEDFTGLTPQKITERAVQIVRDADEEDAIIVPVLKGTLPVGANRNEVDVAQVRAAAEKALLVHPIVQLRESEVSAEIVRSIFESEFKDLKTKAFEYFLQIFRERFPPDEAERIARASVALIEPLVKKQDDKVKQTIEGLAP